MVIYNYYQLYSTRLPRLFCNRTIWDKTMPKEGLKRKLVAILSADVEGYGRLMGNDEGRNHPNPDRLQRGHRVRPHV